MSGVRFLALFNVKGTAAFSKQNILAICRNAAVDAAFTVLYQEGQHLADSFKLTDTQIAHTHTHTHRVFFTPVIVATLLG